MAIPVDIINGGTTVCKVGACELTTIEQTSLIPAVGMITILFILGCVILHFFKNENAKNSSYSFDN